MDIQTIHERIQSGNYLVKVHAIQHALKEGFEREHMVEAVLNGTIIETYPEDRRVLVCGRSVLSEDGPNVHVVADPVYIEFVTAYIPDEIQWESPTFTRRRRRRR